MFSCLTCQVVCRDVSNFINILWRSHCFDTSSYLFWVEIVFIIFVVVWVSYFSFIFIVPGSGTLPGLSITGNYLYCLNHILYCLHTRLLLHKSHDAERANIYVRLAYNTLNSVPTIWLFVESIETLWEIKKLYYKLCRRHISKTM